MLVKIRLQTGNEVHYNSDDTAIMLVFNDKEKELVKNMAPKASRFLIYEDKTMNEKEAQAWLKERP